MERLERHHFHFSHSLGQNFILDPALVDRIVDAAQVRAGDCILEIGPGAGVMTRRMLDLGARVAAVEADQTLRPILEEALGNAATIRYEDALKTDLDELVRCAFDGASYRVVANLPYHIANDVLWRFFRSPRRPRDIVVMVQKEAAERICAARGEKNYCAIAAAAQYLSEPSELLQLPPEAFVPRPHVRSTLLRMKMRPARDAALEAMTLRVISAAFTMRRKTLANNLTHGFALSRERAEAMIRLSGLPDGVRGEAVSPERLEQLAGLLLDGFRSASDE